METLSHSTAKAKAVAGLLILLLVIGLIGWYSGDFRSSQRTGGDVKQRQSGEAEPGAETSLPERWHEPPRYIRDEEGGIRGLFLKGHIIWRGSTVQEMVENLGEPAEIFDYAQERNLNVTLDRVQGRFIATYYLFTTVGQGYACYLYFDGPGGKVTGLHFTMTY